MKQKAERLVLFTAHYPYTAGESFLENEMRYAADRFRKIVIVTAERHPTRETYYLPANADVIESRSGIRQMIGLLLAGFQMFLPSTLRELSEGRKTQGQIRLPKLLKKMLVTRWNLACLGLVRKQWQSQEPALYYAYWLDAEAVYLAKHRKRLSGFCIARAHGGDCFSDRGFHPWRRLQLRRLDGVYPISEAGRADLLKHYGASVPKLAEKIRTLHLGVHFPDKQSNPWERKVEAVIVSCAEIRQLKRLDLLIDALALLKRPVHWIHFGDGELGEAIRQYAAEVLEGKEEIRCTFTGRIPKSRILEYYERESIDMLVHTSDSEGIPVAVMEAMAYGIPVIAKDVGGVAELVDGACGLLLDAGADAFTVMQAMEHVLNMDAGERQKMSGAAREKIRSGFDEKTVFHSLYAPYRYGIKGETGEDGGKMQ